MATEPTRQESNGAARPPDPRTPPPPQRGKSGWRVSPAPDGRGKPPQQGKPPMLPFSPMRFFGLILLLLVVNWAAVALLAPAEKRIRVPYTPTFLTQVRDGNVKEISSEGETVSGEFKKDVTYKDETATNFETEVPTFANTDQLSQLLEDEDVVVNASP